MCTRIKHVGILEGDMPKLEDSALIHVYQPLLVVQDTEQGTKAPPGWGASLGQQSPMLQSERILHGVQFGRSPGRPLDPFAGEDGQSARLSQLLEETDSRPL